METVVFESLYNQLLASIILYLPNVLAAIAILIVGFVFGKVIYNVLKGMLQKANADKYIKFPTTFRISEFIPFVVKWYIYLAFISVAFSSEVLGIPTLSEWISSIMLFIPNVIGASLVLFVGYVIGEWLKEVISSRDTFYSNIAGNTVLFIVVYVALSMALSILSVPTTLIDSILIIVVASVGLGIAIAIGLGLKDLVREISMSAYESYKPELQKKLKK
ncbi:MAG: mechanosensitive ion channel family protein [Candidatus Micrarchaeia archaeon]